MEQTPTDAQAAASSAVVPVPDTAADQAVMSGDVAAFKEARRAERTGKPLPTSPADSSSADVAADSSSATPEPRRDKRATEHRVPELLSERATLRAELETA